MKHTASGFVILVRIPCLICAALLLLMGAFGKRGLLDWNRMHQQNTRLQNEISQLEDQTKQLEEQIALLETDPSEQERVIRQVLGYIKTNETIIEF